MKDYISLEDYNVELKNLVSGPAPVGRVLNYLNLAGNGKLKHKNGHRSTDLSDDIACAWCSEFMVGLGLIHYDTKADQPVKVVLTEDGKRLYKETCKKTGGFNENIDPMLCRSELFEISPNGYEIFKEIFLKSPVYLNLKTFVINKNKRVFKKGKSFNKLYWEEFLNEYSTSENFDPEARTNAGDNRVPSLIQHCIFFKLCTENDGKYVFSLPEAVTSSVTIAYGDVLDDNRSIIEIVNDFEDDVAVENAQVYSSSEDIDQANRRSPTLKPGISTNNRYSTDSRLSKTVLANSSWECGLDNFDGHKHITFNTKKGNKYVEAHHLVPMKAQKDFLPNNLDIYDNIVPLCPNCHKAVHHGNYEEKVKFLKPLYDSRISRLNEYGIFISFDELINKYY